MFTQDDVFKMDASEIKPGVYITIKKHNAKKKKKKKKKEEA